MNVDILEFHMCMVAKVKPKTSRIKPVVNDVKSGGLFFDLKVRMRDMTKNHCPVDITKSCHIESYYPLFFGPVGHGHVLVRHSIFFAKMW